MVKSIISILAEFTGYLSASLAMMVGCRDDFNGNGDCGDACCSDGGDGDCGDACRVVVMVDRVKILMKKSPVRAHRPAWR